MKLKTGRNLQTLQDNFAKAKLRQGFVLQKKRYIVLFTYKALRYIEGVTL